MSKRLEIKEGQRFNLLKVLNEEPQRKWKRYFYCLCDCGNTKVIALPDLRSGQTRSCGCSHRYINLTHGFKKDNPIYQAWIGMKMRCYNKNESAYKDYGQRGIFVCKEWKDDFLTFYEWSILNGWAECLQIDRINNDFEYSPNNCRWTDRITQCNNTRRNIIFEINGVNKTLSQHCRDMGVLDKYHKIYDRVFKLGWEIESAILTC